MMLYMAAARRPPRTEPAKSHDLRPRAIFHSLCCGATIKVRESVNQDENATGVV